MCVVHAWPCGMCVLTRRFSTWHVRGPRPAAPRALREQRRTQNPWPLNPCSARPKVVRAGSWLFWIGNGTQLEHNGNAQTPRARVMHRGCALLRLRLCGHSHAQRVPAGMDGCGRTMLCHYDGCTGLVIRARFLRRSRLRRAPCRYSQCQ